MSEVLQIPDQTALDATALRAYEDACLLTVFSSKLITEANCRCLYDGERGPLIDPWSESNDGILRALTARLELRSLDDTRKVVWYCRPPRPLFAPGAQNRDAGECP